MKQCFIEKSHILIEKLVPGGQGIGSDENGKKGFFWNVLPSEIVTSYTITKNKSHYFEAIAETIENPSAHRITPKDPCFLSTSPWQIMNYDYELAQKKELLVEQFKQAGIGLSASKPVITDHHDFHYRNKMEYALYWDVEKEKILLAFHQRDSHRKIPISSSSIERPEIFAKIRHILLMEDFIVYKLTGNACIDYSLAARTMALDIRNKCWSDEILFASGISE